MKQMALAALVACAAAISTPAMANGLALEARGARAHGAWGAELGVGYAFGAAGFKLRPMVGAFVYDGNGDRYFEDDESSGWTRCRDKETGGLVEDKKCDDRSVKPYARVEATYTIPFIAEFGVGARFSSDKARPYGTVALPVGPAVKLQANAGPKYYALGVSLNF